MDAAQALPSIGTPAAELAIDTTLVAGLLAEQHPGLAHLTLQAVEAGWDNARNVQFYEKLGFTVVVHDHIPKGGPPFWTMVRTPQT